ncbi:MAG: antibiotic biosynthesis monooxygenase family protein [Bacteroidia bacterium]
MNKIADTPKPPYYAVIFTSLKNPDDTGYTNTAALMNELAGKQPGYLGIESAREDLGITVSYWKDLESIKAWKQNSEHLFAQKMGREKWYAHYKTRICLVERDYEFTTGI